MIAAGITFGAGSILQAFAMQVLMLIFGRILLGLGVGLATQSAPLYLSEMAPYKLRGALNIMFQVGCGWGSHRVDCTQQQESATAHACSWS